jgi:uncharacterized protein (TIGR00369 family)
MSGMDHPPHFSDERPYPLQHHLGFVLTDWSEDYCRLELPLEAFLMNRQGIPHGGVYATLADTAMGYAGCFAPKGAPPRWAMTLNLSVNYLAQCKGDLLIATANRTGGGRKTFFANASISDNLSTKIASATGVFRYRSNPP